MERRKPGANSDELPSPIKAAAWAWYQHRVGSEEKSAKEFGISRIHRIYKPSRFKLEAMRKPTESTENPETSPVHSQTSLLDAYEIEMISKRFDSLSLHIGDTYNQGTYIDDHQEERKKPSLQGSIVNSIQKRNKKWINGFWLVRPTAICGSSKRDVIEPKKLNRRHRKTHG